MAGNETGAAEKVCFYWCHVKVCLGVTFKSNVTFKFSVMLTPYFKL
jgi:hypothetical protein